MASSDNVTKQDSIYDPDIEARLYAEIYYSNETYGDDFEQARNNETASIVDNVTPPSSSTSLTNTIGVNPSQNKENNLPIINNFVQEHREIVNEIGQFNLSKSPYPAQNWIFGKLPQYHSNQVNTTDVRKKYPKRQRLLAHEGLWLTPEVTHDRQRQAGNTGISAIVNQSERPEVADDRQRQAGSTEISATVNQSERPEVTDDRQRQAESTEISATANHPERPEAPQDLNERNRRAESSATERLAVTLRTSPGNRTIDKRSNDHSDELARRKSAKQKRTLKNRERREKQRIKKILILKSTKALSRTKKLRRNRETLDNVGVTTALSKYHVVAKKKKLKMRETCQESVEISSDSDDSILEVPIPPKAPPPLIQLPDSDDEFGKNGRNEKNTKSRMAKNCETSREENKETTPCYSIETDSSDESLSRPTRESSPLSMNEINENTRDDDTNNDETRQNNIGSQPDETDNLIINCTDIQRRASSLEEIRKIRDNLIVHGHSDDSMTESEATNWINIAAKQADTTSERGNSTIEKEHLSLWEQLTIGNNIETTSEIFLNTINQTNVTKNSPTLSMINDDTMTKRKRRETGESSGSRVFSMPEIPEKRSKRKSNKTSSDKSMSEYFFKPMSREMQAFYNNPWGGENLDVFDIQSRMPRNPNCWTILDSDLRGPTTKRQRVCPRCKSDSHYGKRCPEKPKPPCCSMCGVMGHTETRCPETMCLTCGNKYATYRPTCGHCSKLFCNMCHGTGHTSKNCPDLWRRYHNTTTETLPVVPRDPENIMKAPQYLSCCNCAKRGHDVTMCRQLRWTQHFTTPMYVSSYTDGPIYPPSFHERIQATSPLRFIDLTNVPIDCDPPNAKISDSPSTSRLVIEYGKFDDSDSALERTISKRLDQLTNVHLSGLLSGVTRPTFLQTWQENFVFGVKITHGPNNEVMLVIQASNDEQLCSLDKILMQWLTRQDHEKEYLIYHELPYNDIPKLIIELRNKLCLLGRLSQPWVILKKIAAMKECSNEGAGKDRRSVIKPRTKKLREKIERQGQLVASLYKKSWIDGGEEMIQLFRDRVSEIEGKTEITVENHMEITYLYNEIFTYRESEALMEALEKAKASLSMPLRETIEPPLRNNDQDNENFVNLPIPNVNNFYIDCSPTKSNLFPIDDRPGSSSMMTRCPETQNYNFIPPLMSTDPFALEGGNLQSFQATLVLNHYGKVQKKRASKKGVKVKDACGDLLSNLTKKQRKACRRSARRCIDLAKSSRLSHLIKMANELRNKMKNNSVRTNDVQSLRVMLHNNNIGEKKMKKSPGVRPTKKIANERYNKFCQSL